MTRRFLLWVTALLLGIFMADAQYMVNCISETGESMTFRVVGYGKNAQKATADGELSVIKALMFHGIPDTQQSVPMVPETEDQLMKKHSKFLENFFADGYRSVVLRSVTVRKFGKDDRKQKSVGLEVTVNVRALRNELTRNGVLRKFGF